MQVLAHLDPVVLEDQLVERLDATHPRDGTTRTLVVVPTRRLVEHVELRLSRARPAWIGVEVRHLQALVLAILGESGAPLPRLFSTRVRRALLDRELERGRERPWGRFVARRPGAATRLMAALDDLREAGLTPEQLEAGVGSERERDLARLYRGYVAELERARQSGLVDEAGLVRAALPHAARFAGRRGAVFLHGTHELNGIYLDLLRAIDEVTRVVALVPVAVGQRVSQHAEDFARRFLLGGHGEIETLVGSGGDLERPALDVLYDEPARPAPAERFFGFRRTQGPAAEVRIAVREAMAAIREGCPPREIVIAVRHAEPYAAAVEEAFEDDPLPWTSSFKAPLRRQPLVRDFLLLLQVAVEDFPRGPTAELLRSPRLGWAVVHPGVVGFAGDEIDAWSRRARILGGLEEWTTELPRWAARSESYAARTDDQRREDERRAQARAEQARGIGALLVRLRDEIAPEEPRSWDEHARRLGTLLDDLFEPVEGDDGPRAGVREALHGLLDEMSQLELLLPGSTVRLADVRGWLEAAVSESRLPLRGGDDGGIRVLDAMQLRGLTFRRAHLLGMNSGSFPAPPREDPVLDDALRLRLSEDSGRPLPVKSRGIREERLLLATLAGCARERLDVSWQRADDSGKARTTSLALREIARLALGEPKVKVVEDLARRLPSHPEQWLEQLRDAPSLWSDEDRLLDAALKADTRSAHRELEGLDPGLAPGLAMLSATQAFAFTDAAYDARVGLLPGRVDLSVSALERLGCCPLQLFFERVLGVRELEEPASPIEITAREMGTWVHEVLERLYRQLLLENPARPSSLSSLRDAARQRLAEERELLTGELGARLSTRLPVLWAHLSVSWFDALGAFVDADVTRLVGGGWRVEALEEPRSAEIDLGGGATLRIRGRFDRRVVREGATVVGDYKTGGKLADRCNPTAMLKAHALQVPLYHLLAGDRPRVELLGVGPEFVGDGERLAAFDGFDDERQREGFLETLGVLADLWRRGTFPLRSGRHCGWCAYRQACRRNDPPTVEREEGATDTADFRLLADKNKSKKVKLADVRPASGGTG